MNQVAYISKINKITDKFEQEYGRKPSFEEIEDITGLNSNKINLAMSSTNRAISLDNPFKDEEIGSLLDVIPNENSEESDVNIIQNHSLTIINNILSKLSYRERDIIRMSFGIEMSPMQNEEIANRFGISCERVRQIIKESLEKIKNEYGDELKELL
jgi:RNA polymerase primary sigma factor